MNGVPAGFFIGLFGLILSLSSCGDESYLISKSFTDNCWSIQDTLRFAYQHQAGTAPVKVSASITFQQDYRYQNFHLKVRYTSPSGETQEVLLSEFLIDAEGNWIPEQSGGAYPVLMTSSDISFNEPGTYSFQAYQFMREENLCEIEKVGIGIK